MSISKRFDKDLFLECVAAVRESFPENSLSPDFIFQKAQLLYSTRSMNDKELRQMAMPKEDSITCMICYKSFKSLKRHLRETHKEGLDDDDFSKYKKTYNIPPETPLVALSLSRKRAGDATRRQGKKGFVKASKEHAEDTL